MPSGDSPPAVSRLLLIGAELEGFPRDGIHCMSEGTPMAALEGISHLRGRPLEGKVLPQYLSSSRALDIPRLPSDLVALSPCTLGALRAPVASPLLAHPEE